MLITKKNQYALRAIFELAKHNGKGPRKISDVAQAQAIPEKFLEVILNQLKGSGLVDSKRGFTGGYFLIRSPEKITVGDIMRFMERDVDLIGCVALVPETNCPFKGDCAPKPTAHLRAIVLFSRCGPKLKTLFSKFMMRPPFRI
jgi:Rrf2 family protein